MTEELVTIPEATNYQYTADVSCRELKIFVSHVNSFHGSAFVRKILSQTSKSSDDVLEDTANDDNEGGKITFKFFGTLKSIGEDHGCPQNVTILNSNNDEPFLDEVTNCDFIICDISEDLSEAKRIVNHIEAELKTSEITNKKHLILLSTIMTWFQTPHQEMLTDLNYRKRRPHPCFGNHLILERDVVNLTKKFGPHIASVVVCPGIIYGGRQDIFHHIYKKCYFNNIQLDIFVPGTNLIPLIYIEDFLRILEMMIRNFPDSSFPYVLAIQPELIPIKDVVEVFANAAGGPETRIRVCQRDEIFVMNEELMSQRVYNHLTLNVQLESEFLRTFDFELTGFNLNLNADMLADKFYKSRNLKPIKILIDGSPFAYQGDLAEMLANFYSLHRIQAECVLENNCLRLKRKLKKAEQYIEHMKSFPIGLYDDLVDKVEIQISEWKKKLEIICERIKNETEPKFHEVQDLVVDRLMSFACSKHQGYVMDGFELDSEMASHLFLEQSDDSAEFNDSTKPDFVIIMNRALDHDSLCMEIEEKLADEELKESSEEIKQRRLKDYYNSHFEDVSLLNFFLDRDIIPLEINFDRDMKHSDLIEIFESIKLKIGGPRTYELSREEQEENLKLKQEIERQEAAEKAEIARLKAQEELREKELKLKEWTEQMMQKKKQEIQEMEKHCLPVRHYLMKYVIPSITDGLMEVARIRPENAIEFLARYMIAQGGCNIEEDDELDEEIVSEFRKLARCGK